jgi:hypothetical protein
MPNFRMTLTNTEKYANGIKCILEKQATKKRNRLNRFRIGYNIRPSELFYDRICDLLFTHLIYQR